MSSPELWAMIYKTKQPWGPFEVVLESNNFIMSNLELWAMIYKTKQPWGPFEVVLESNNFIMSSPELWAMIYKTKQPWGNRAVLHLYAALLRSKLILPSEAEKWLRGRIIQSEV